MTDPTPDYIFESAKNRRADLELRLKQIDELVAHRTQQHQAEIARLNADKASAQAELDNLIPEIEKREPPGQGGANPGQGQGQGGN